MLQAIFHREAILLASFTLCFGLAGRGQNSNIKNSSLTAPERAEKMVQIISAKIPLTPPQKDRLKKANLAFLRQLDGLDKEKKPDPGRKLREMNSLNIQLDSIYRTILTPDQFRKFKTLDLRSQNLPRN